MSPDIEGRKLADLRVVDLRAELEKRGLDKSGNKQILLERLQKALKEENIDSESHTFQTEKGENLDEGRGENSQNGDDSKPEDDIDTTHKVEDEDNKTVESSQKVKRKEDEEELLDADEIKTEVEDEDLLKPLATSNDDTDKKKSTNPEDTQPVSKASAMQEDLPDENNDANGLQDEVQDNVQKDNEENQNEEEKTDTKDNADEDKVGVEASNAQQAADDSTSEVKKETSDQDKPSVEKTDEDRKEVKSENKETAAKTSLQEKSQVKPTAASKALQRERFLNEQNRNLWITNISQNTRATELKQALSEHGKVIGAKVVINARHPAACCYGYVKMETAADADNCIAKLNNTELNGQIIRIEKVRPDHLSPLKHKLETSQKEKLTTRQSTSSTQAVTVKTEPKDEKTEVGKETVKDKEEKKVDKPVEKKDIKEKKKPEVRRHVYRSRSRDRKSREDQPARSTSRGRNERSLSTKSANRGRERERDMLTFDKIKDERERERLRERERIIRDRRREEAARQREIERHQRSEAVRLERERDKLKRERERLEREKAEFMQFERERQKIEREKLELERIELERAKLRMQEEERRAVKRPAPAGYRERERSYEDRKRMTSDRHFDEAPPPPRFDPPSSLKSRDPSPPVKKFTSNTSSSKDYSKTRINYDKREAFPPKREYEDRSHPPSLSRGAAPIPKYDSNSSYSGRDRGDIRDPRVREPSGLTSISNTKYTSTDSKVSRYNERERSPHFRSVRDARDRRPIADAKSELRNPRNDHRYTEQPKESVRYERTSSSGSNWSPQKVFSATSNPTNKQWSKDGWRSDNPGTAERWNTTNPQRSTTGLSSSAFSGTPGMSMVPSCPPPPGINNYVNDRFDYKSNIGGMRKY